MGGAYFWGSIASSSLLIGSGLALHYRIGERTLGIVMAFGSGVLISAVAYELVGEAFTTSAGQGGVVLGLFAGSIMFFAGDLWIDRLGGDNRKRSGGQQSGGSGLPIVLGTVDGSSACGPS